MTFTILTNWISPHLLPLYRCIERRLGAGNCRYVYTGEMYAGCRRVCWGNAKVEAFCLEYESEEGRAWVEKCDVLLVGIRAWDVLHLRARVGKISFYMSERWFKPPLGMFRLLSPSYFRMARELVRLVHGGTVKVLPIGVHAAYDMYDLNCLMRGDVVGLVFRRPAITEKKPLGRIGEIPWMRLWGYFVDPSSNFRTEGWPDVSRVLKLLWVGRILKLKHVETIIKAVSKLPQDAVHLSIVGDGPEKIRLETIAKHCKNVQFYPRVDIVKVRMEMRKNDVYVFASDGDDGWGAVVNEALEEGMEVIGTYEAGASATMLPKSRLFHSGDWRSLRKILEELVEDKRGGAWTRRTSIGDWSADLASKNLLSYCGYCNANEPERNYTCPVVAERAIAFERIVTE